MYYRFPSFRPNQPPETKTAREYLSEILSRSDQCKSRHPGRSQRYTSNLSRNHNDMPSSKGKPTDPQLREEVKEEVKKESKGTTRIPFHSTPPFSGPRVYDWNTTGKHNRANLTSGRRRSRLVVGVEGVGDGQAVRGERRRLRGHRRKQEQGAEGRAGEEDEG